MGYSTSRVTLEDVGLRARAAGRGRNVVLDRLRLALEVAWFTIAATVVVRQKATRQNVVVISHGDQMAGHIHVNHGILLVALARRGSPISRNPLHWFVLARERVRYSLGLHDLVVSLNDDDAASLHDLYGLPLHKSVTIPNGVDLQRFTVPTDDERRFALAETGSSANELRLLFVGHEFERKGLHQAIDALELLPQEVVLLVAGGDAQSIEAAEQQVDAKGLRGRVTFLGRLEDVTVAYHAADVFVFPTRYEASPLVLLEALACGLPLVVTPTALASDVVSSAHLGRTMSGEPSGIAEAVMQVAEDRALLGAGAVAKECRDRATQYSWERAARVYANEVERIMQGRM